MILVVNVIKVALYESMREMHIAEIVEFEFSTVSLIELTFSMLSSIRSYTGRKNTIWIFFRMSMIIAQIVFSL